MKNEQVAEAFKQGRTAKTKHFFIKKNVIYSYGYHFPIVIKFINQNILLFNKDGYSVTTARHKNLVKREFVGFTIIELKTEQLKDIINKGITDINELYLNELSKGVYI